LDHLSSSIADTDSSASHLLYSRAANFSCVYPLGTTGGWAMLSIANEHLTMNPFKGAPFHKMISSLETLSATAFFGINDATIYSRSWVPQSFSPTQARAAATLLVQGSCSRMSAILELPPLAKTGTEQDLLSKPGLVDPLAGFAKRARQQNNNTTPQEAQNVSAWPPSQKTLLQSVQLALAWNPRPRVVPVL
jgi:hypothetical protein